MPTLSYRLPAAYRTVASKVLSAGFTRRVMPSKGKLADAFVVRPSTGELFRLGAYSDAEVHGFVVLVPEADNEPVDADDRLFVITDKVSSLLRSETLVFEYDPAAGSCSMTVRVGASSRSVSLVPVADYPLGWVAGLGQVVVDAADGARAGLPVRVPVSEGVRGKFKVLSALCVQGGEFAQVRLRPAGAGAVGLLATDQVVAGTGEVAGQVVAGYVGDVYVDALLASIAGSQAECVEVAAGAGCSVLCLDKTVRGRSVGVLTVGRVATSCRVPFRNAVDSVYEGLEGQTVADVSIWEPEAFGERLGAVESVPVLDWVGVDASASAVRTPAGGFGWAELVDNRFSQDSARIVVPRRGVQLLAGVVGESMRLIAYQGRGNCVEVAGVDGVRLVCAVSQVGADVVEAAFER